MTKEQTSKVLTAVIVLIISLLSAFGYDTLIIQPRDVSHAEVQAVMQEYAP